jgi:hypothetical protein
MAGLERLRTNLCRFFRIDGILKEYDVEFSACRPKNTKKKQQSINHGETQQVQSDKERENQFLFAAMACSPSHLYLWPDCTMITQYWSYRRAIKQNVHQYLSIHPILREGRISV